MALGQRRDGIESFWAWIDQFLCAVHSVAKLAHGLAPHPGEALQRLGRKQPSACAQFCKIGWATK